MIFENNFDLRTPYKIFEIIQEFIRESNHKNWFELGVIDIFLRFFEINIYILNNLFYLFFDSQ